MRFPPAIREYFIDSIIFSTYEELEKEAVDKFVPFERKKTIEKTYVDAFKNDGYGTVKVSMAIQNQRQRIYRDKEACWRHDACGAYQGDYT